MDITILRLCFDNILTCNEKCTLSWVRGWMLLVCISVYDEFELIQFNIRACIWMRLRLNGICR